jgi:type II secretory pathway component PulM
LRRPLSPAQTAGWILLVVLLPLIGTLVYFLLRKPTEEEILRAQEAAAEQRDSSSSVHQRLPGE